MGTKESYKLTSLTFFRFVRMDAVHFRRVSSGDSRRRMVLLFELIDRQSSGGEQFFLVQEIFVAVATAENESPVAEFHPPLAHPLSVLDEAAERSDAGARADHLRKARYIMHGKWDSTAKRLTMIGVCMSLG